MFDKFLRLSIFCAALFMSVGIIACEAPSPKFSRDEAIAKAKNLVETAFYTHGGKVEKIQTANAELLKRAEAFQKIDQPTNEDADDLVWFVTVKAPFWSLSPPIWNEGETRYRKAEYRGDEHYYIFDSTTGEQIGHASNGDVVGFVNFP